MTPGSKRRTFATFAGIAALSLTAAACGSSSTGTSSSGAADSTDYSNWCGMKDKLQGKTVTIYTSIVAPEDAAQKDSYKPFESCTGVTVKYEGDKDFEKNLPARAQSGNLPDVAFIPQPGLLKTMVDTGKAIPASGTVSKLVDQNFGKDWKTYGTVDGTLYAAPLGANVKSLVWYSPAMFKAKGYAVPKTWDELMTLTEKISKEDAAAKPWCAGIESGAATGWPATDWMEELMLRVNGPAVYDDWINHKIPFNDPKVAAAMAKVGAILKNPAYVNGGIGDVKSIATTSFGDAGKPILQKKCYMYQMASFYATQWPAGTKVAEDGDVWAFYEPSLDATKPVEGGGEFTMTFRDAPEVKAFAAYLASADWANNKAKATPKGGWVSANKGLDIANLASPIDKESAKILQDSSAVFRFDASDLMPSAVGAGSFWKEMTNWINGQSDEVTLKNIEASWPKK